MSTEFGMRPLFQLFAMLLAGLIAGSMLQLFLLGDTPPDEAAVDKPVRLLLGMMSFQLLTFAIPAIIWSRLHHHALFSKGSFPVSLSQIGLLVLFFLAVFFFANELNYWIIAILTESGSSLVGGLEEQMGVYQALFDKPDLLWLNILVFGLIPAFSEELFFRGIVFNYLKDRLNSFTHAAVISSLFFAGMHMEFVQLIPIFLLGFALAVVYHFSGKLWLSMVLHAANNSIQVVALSQQWEWVWGGFWIVIPMIVALLLYRSILSAKSGNAE
jgi:uncharacterized protein